MDPGGMPGAPDRDRAPGHTNRNFGPDAKPKRAGAKYQQRQEKPKGPIREKNTGRVYSVDAFGEDEPDTGEDLSNFDNFASSLPDDEKDEGQE
jgi:hypothetical protein